MTDDKYEPIYQYRGIFRKIGWHDTTEDKVPELIKKGFKVRIIFILKKVNK